jgi:hypothetical protein
VQGWAGRPPDADAAIAALHLEFGDSRLGDHLNQFAYFVQSHGSKKRRGQA